MSELRKDLKINQEEFGKIIGVTRDTISKYECERIDPPDDIKIKIAQFFNISLDYLMGLNNTPTPIKNGNDFIRIPPKLSNQAREDLKDYIKYLTIKYNI